MRGRIAAITGGGRGIGLACAEALAEAGARVVLMERDESLADEGAKILASQGAKVDSVILDVTDSQAVGAAAEAIERDIGAIDVLVCFAGIVIAASRQRTRRTSSGGK